jgi:hypothetical protein
MMQAYRTSFLLGIVSGLFGLLWMILSALYAAEGSPVQLMAGPISLFVMGVCIVVEMFLLRKRHAGEKLSFGTAMRSGLLIALFTSILLTIGSYIYCTQIEPDFAELMISRSEAYFAKEGKSAEDIAKNSEMLREAFTLKAELNKTFVGTMLMGFLFSLIFSLVFSNRKFGTVE